MQETDFEIYQPREVRPHPWLSVIMPTFNGERFLHRALASVADQADDDIECIVVDDGSTDATLRIAKDFRHRIPMRIHSLRRSGNWAANTNDALATAKGEYACFLHQDDCWLPGRVNKMRRMSNAYPAAQWILSAAVFIDGKDKRVGVWNCPLPAGEGYLDSRLLFQRLLIQNFISIPGPIFKRKTALEEGGLDPSLWYTADWDFWLKLARKKACFCPSLLVAFRIHSDSQTVIRSFDISSFRKQMEQVLTRHLENPPAMEPIPPVIRKMAQCSIKINASLAAFLHAKRVEWFDLAAALLRLGPTRWPRLLYTTRIMDRVVSRLRASLLD